MQQVTDIYNELFAKYDFLLEKVQKVYESNLAEIKKEGRLEDLDVSLLETDSYVQRALLKSRKNSEEYLVQPLAFDQEKVTEVLEKRVSMLISLEEKLSTTRLGTTINILRELPHDVEIDFERNRFHV